MDPTPDQNTPTPAFNLNISKEDADVLVTGLDALIKNVGVSNINLSGHALDLTRRIVQACSPGKS